MKQTVLQQAWKQRNIQFEGHTIYFDQDYLFEVQRKRKKVWEAIKKLKEKNIKAQALYPAQLRISLESGTRIFSTLLEAQPTLKDLGVDIALEDRDVLEMEMAREAWTTQPNGRKKNRHHLKTSDIREFICGMEEDE